MESQEITKEKAQEVSTEVVDPGQSFSWQASEFIHHQKSAGWYMVLALITIALVIAAIVTRQWFSIAVFATMTAAVVVYASKEPRVLSYRLDNAGITIDGKPNPYKNFKSYSVLQDTGWHMIDLDPTQRFMPRVSIIFDTEDLDKITAILNTKMPRVDRQPDWIEKLTRSIRF
jgi:hypothetical protein